MPQLKSLDYKKFTPSADCPQGQVNYQSKSSAFEIADCIHQNESNQRTHWKNWLYYISLTLFLTV